jgi:hypothetical protein
MFPKLTTSLMFKYDWLYQKIACDLGKTKKNKTSSVEASSKKIFA